MAGSAASIMATCSPRLLAWFTREWLQEMFHQHIPRVLAERPHPCLRRLFIPRSDA